MQGLSRDEFQTRDELSIDERTLPAGFTTNDVGQFVPVDWLQIIFNPSFPYRLVHTVLAAFLTTAFAVGAVEGFGVVVIEVEVEADGLVVVADVFRARGARAERNAAVGYAPTGHVALAGLADIGREKAAHSGAFGLRCITQ